MLSISSFKFQCPGCDDLSDVWDKTVTDCIAKSKCWDIVTPCHDACDKAFQICKNKCTPMDRHDCFFTCYDKEFKKLKPAVPKL